MNAAEHSGNGDLFDQQLTDAVKDITARRALIEQAKGMLMVIYGLDADEAFEVLRRQSQVHNIKLRLIAEQIMKDLVELARSESPNRRLASDGVLLTAHQRITQVAGRKRVGQPSTT